MAATVSTVVNGLPGNLKVWTGRITPDGATAIVTVPGANNIVALLSFGCVSGVSISCVNVGVNSSTTGTAVCGVLGLTGMIATQLYYVTVLYN